MTEDESVAVAKLMGYPFVHSDGNYFLDGDVCDSIKVEQRMREAGVRDIYWKTKTVAEFVEQALQALK